MNRARLIAALAVVGILIYVAVMLSEPYFDNWELQQYLDSFIADASNRARPDGVLEATVADHAAKLGIPVSPGEVHVLRAGDSLRIEVRYAVRVDLPLYTVDLHFRPGAGKF